jgi:hypothetical protein
MMVVGFSIADQIKALLRGLVKEPDVRKRMEIKQLIDNLRLQEQLMKGG